MTNITYTELHVHTEYSLKDGMIRIADYKDPKHIKADIIRNAEARNTGAVTATDHGNMYGQALLASVCKTFGLKHIPGCEFYVAPESRLIKEKTDDSNYMHMCGWAKNKQGYENMCILQKLSYTEGFYYRPRIDKELLDKYGDNIMWSDACVGGILSQLILSGQVDRAYNDFLWYLDRFKDDFYIEYQNHGLDIEEKTSTIKIEWAKKHGVPIIATSDAHYALKDDAEAHRVLLCTQYQNWKDNPTFSGFSGDGYWLMNDEELLSRFPVEYLNNTQLIVDKVEDGIIKFGNITPPQFVVPEWFK